MNGPFVVPIKDVEISVNVNANQIKTVFGYFSFVLYFTLSEACFFIKSIKINILWYLIIREGQIFFIINNNEDV